MICTWQVYVGFYISPLSSKCLPLLASLSGETEGKLTGLLNPWLVFFLFFKCKYCVYPIPMFISYNTG